MLLLLWVVHHSTDFRLILAHHSALLINTFTLTHRGDEPRPATFYQAVEKTLRICLGVERMRQVGLFQIYGGGDFGILWPLVIAGIWAPEGVIREWLRDLLNNWPREGMLVVSHLSGLANFRINLMCGYVLKLCGPEWISDSVSKDFTMRIMSVRR